MDNPSRADPTRPSGTDAATGAIGDLEPVPPKVRRAFWKRLIFLAVTLVSLYLLWPSLLSVFSAWPDLVEINVAWFAAMLVGEIASFLCMWALIALAVRTHDMFAVATSQLVGTAVSRVVPAGAAAGPALQFRMMVDAGMSAARVGSGLAATSLIGGVTLLALPVLAVPTALIGSPIPPGLENATLFGAVVFLLLMGVGAISLSWDRPLEALGRALQWLRNRLYRRRRPITNLPERLVQERNDLRKTLGSTWWKALLYAIGNSLFDYLALLSALTAVGSSPRPALVLLGYVTARILSFVPITPGGLGFVEAGLTGMLLLAGISGADTVLATLAYRLVSFWLPLPAGLAAFALFRRRYGNGG
jgi:uncharacterized protein (TIRG00374 family)